MLPYGGKGSWSFRGDVAKEVNYTKSVLLTFPDQQRL
jgi:hypothetical protein